MLSAFFSADREPIVFSADGTSTGVEGFMSWCEVRDHPTYSVGYGGLQDDLDAFLSAARLACEVDGDGWDCRGSVEADSPDPTPATTQVPADTTTTTTSTLPPTTTTTAQECSFADSIPRAMDAVVQVVTDVGTGTAFHLGWGLFATAAHVVVDAEDIDLLIGSVPIDARVGAWDTTLDLAFLTIVDEDPNLPVLEWADTSSLMPGAEVAVIGFPTGVTGSASVTDGRVSRIVTYPGDITFIQTNAEANPGNSGGPLITECGAVVGVVLSKLVAVEIEGISYALDASTSRVFYDWWAGVEPAVPVVYDWQPSQTVCMTSDEESWLWQISSYLDRLVAVEDDFFELWQYAVDETGTLVEDDPTWEQAVIIAGFRFEEPALALLDLLPAPGGLAAYDHLIAATAEMIADFAQDLPRAMAVGDVGTANQIIADLDYTGWVKWVDSIFYHCTNS